MRERFLELLTQRKPGATYRLLPFPPGSFDGVWLCASLLHVPWAEWPDTVRAYHALVDGGCLLVSVKHGRGERTVPSPKHPGEERYFVYVSEAELDLVLREAGFRVLSLRRTPGEPDHDWLEAFAS